MDWRFRVVRIAATDEQATGPDATGVSEDACMQQCLGQPDACVGAEYVHTQCARVPVPGWQTLSATPARPRQ